MILNQTAESKNNKDGIVPLRKEFVLLIRRDNAVPDSYIICGVYCVSTKINFSGYGTDPTFAHMRRIDNNSLAHEETIKRTDLLWYINNIQVDYPQLTLYAIMKTECDADGVSSIRGISVFKFTDSDFCLESDVKLNRLTDILEYVFLYSVSEEQRLSDIENIIPCMKGQLPLFLSREVWDVIVKPSSVNCGYVGIFDCDFTPGYSRRIVLDDGCFECEFLKDLLKKNGWPYLKAEIRSGIIDSILGKKYRISLIKDGNVVEYKNFKSIIWYGDGAYLFCEEHDIPVKK